jgi:hypothetical protein
MILVLMVGAMLITPTMARADGLKSAILISGISLTVIGAVVLIMGNLKYDVESAGRPAYDSQWPTINRDHRENNATGGVMLGLGLSTIPLLIWKIKSDNAKESANVSIRRVDNTNLLMVSRAF